MKIGILLLALLAVSNLLADVPKERRAYLKPGAMIIKMQTVTPGKRVSGKGGSNTVQISKGINVVVQEMPGQRGVFFIINKSGEKTGYVVAANEITEIEDDIRLLPRVDAEVIYPPASELKSNNKSAFFDSQFNVHLDNLQTSGLNSIYNQDLANAVGNRYELRTLYVSDFPVNFGLGMNYQTVYFSNDVDSEIKLSILSFGPQIERLFYEEGDVTVSILGGVEYAPVYKSTSGEFVDKFSAVLLDLGVEATWDTRYGKWTLGSHYRRHDLALTSTTRTATSPVPEDIIINSIGGMIGYKYEWDL